MTTDTPTAAKTTDELIGDMEQRHRRTCRMGGARGRKAPVIKPRLSVDGAPARGQLIQYHRPHRMSTVFIPNIVLDVPNFYPYV